MNDGQEDFQAAHSRFKTLLPYVRELDQLLRDHPGLPKTPLEDMDEDEDDKDDADAEAFPTPYSASLSL
jgi:hypothetical protein